MDTRLGRMIRHLFLFLYLIYAVSPMIGDVDRPARGITADGSSAVVKLLLVDRFLDALFDVDRQDTAGDDDPSDDFFVRKFRSLPGGNSLGKQIYSESHAETSQLSEQPDLTSLQTGIVSHDVSSFPAPEPFEGHGTQHSGLAPPYLLS